MYLRFLFCIILFIPHLNANSISTPSADSPKNLSNNTVESQTKDVSNNTKVTLITEGGSIEPEPQLATLPKEMHPNLINLDKEIGKTKTKSIVPRKGVKYNPLEDNVTEKLSTKDRADTTVVGIKKPVTKIVTSADEPPQNKPSTASYLPSSTVNNTATNDDKQLLNEQKLIHKKPLVLSAEAISETDKKVAMERAKLGISSKPIIQDQLPVPKSKYEEIGTGSHPGMVMPIVITMLVVPMFAVLGYMALRRGQEAWKNRHYKRMDFLLDGMYND